MNLTPELKLIILNEEFVLCQSNNINYCPFTNSFIKIYKEVEDGILTGNFSDFISDSITCIIRHIYNKEFVKDQFIKIETIEQLEKLIEYNISGIPKWGIPYKCNLKTKGTLNIQSETYYLHNKIIRNFVKDYSLRSYCIPDNERIDTVEGLILGNLIENIKPFFERN